MGVVGRATSACIGDDLGVFSGVKGMYLLAVAVSFGLRTPARPLLGGMVAVTLMGAGGAVV